jgi:hypothetical protein
MGWQQLAPLASNARLGDAIALADVRFRYATTRRQPSRRIGVGQ